MRDMSTRKSPSRLMLIALLLVSGCLSSQSNLVRGKQYLEQKKYDQAISALEKAANAKGDIYYYKNLYIHW